MPECKVTENQKQKWAEQYLGSMLMISHNSMLIAQSGPMSKSLVALSAHAVALLAMSLSLQWVKSFSINLLQIQTKNKK
jgi:hypothetical protein